MTSDLEALGEPSRACFCPELLEEVGAELGLPVRTRGYTYAGTPA